MDSFRTLGAAFSASLAIHAFLGYSLTLPSGGVKPPENETIMIDYVWQEQVSAPQVAAQPAAKHAKAASAAPAVKRKIKGIPVPRMETPTDFQKIVDEKIKKQLQQLKRLEAPPPWVSSSMTSAELLNDPQKGAVFLTYFSKVKKNIQSTVYQKAGRNLYGRGTVCVAFTLNAEGQLEKLAVLPKGTEADETMKELALQCIRDSSPFGSFPKDLGPGSIVFNITIFFDGGN